MANDTQPNRLYLSALAGGDLGFRFDEVGQDVGVDDDNAGMGVASGDFDGDQRSDVAITNLGEQLHICTAVMVRMGLRRRPAEIGLADLGPRPPGGARIGSMPISTPIST